MVSQRQRSTIKRFREEQTELVPKPEPPAPKDLNKKKKNKNSKFKRKKSDLGKIYGTSGQDLWILGAFRFMDLGKIYWEFLKADTIGGAPLSDSFALPAAEFPELKPNSIYFANALDEVMCPCTPPIGGHDIGIFNYENKTVLPCYYPSDVKNMPQDFPRAYLVLPKSCMI
ncbi:Unknown protein [Striga hermonthica]|uniref:DUF295 domain-containing protein n=1 Tax=Striga hermonthica TaxID=68872 RepID=A0A9N7N4G6_STRHE|nr:Unknown protein [Striga hermonthica]